MIDRGQKRINGCTDNIHIETRAPMDLAVFVTDSDIRDRTGAGALFKRMFLICHKIIFQTEMTLHRIADCIQTAISGGNNNALLLIVRSGYLCDNSIMLFEMYLVDPVRYRNILEFFLEQLENFVRRKLLLAQVGGILRNIAHRLTHLLRKLQAIVLLKDITHTALAGLAVDPDDIRVVGSSDIGRIDRQIRSL